MEVIQLGADASGAVNELNRLLSAMNAQNIAMDDLIVKSQQFDKAGVASKATVSTQISEFVKLEATLKNVNNIWEVNTSKIVADTAALEKNAKAAKAAATAASQTTTRNAARGQAETELRGYFPIPQTASIAQMASYETNLQRVLKLVGTGKITFEQFNDAFNKVKSGDKNGLTGFTESQVKAYLSLQRLAGAFKDTKTDLDKLGDSAQKAGLSLKNLFNIGEALLFKAALSAVTSQITSAIGAAVRFQISISEIRTISQDNQSTFNQWAASITKVSNALGMPVADVAAAAYDTLSNQTTKGAAATERFLMVAGEFARVTVSSTKDSVNLLTSAFNSYKLPVEDAERVSAIFFKTIDLGRIKASDLANSFGRIAQPAAALGVSLEETTAAIATLTRQGVTPADAMTQLLNVFIKLIKPTEQMKALLSSWGTPTGEAAVATFGFAGVLKKLEEATHGSIGELSNLFNEIRGLRGASGLTSGGLFKEFEKDLGLIKNAGKDYDLAKIIRAESSADTLVKEFTKVKNFFINDFGQSILDVGKQINDMLKGFDQASNNLFGKGLGFGSIEESIKTVTTAIVKGATAWLAYKAIMLTFAGLSSVISTLSAIRTAISAKIVATTADTAATAANTAATAANTAATGANAAAKTGLLATLGRYIPTLATLTAGGYFVYEMFVKSKKATEEYTDSVAALDEKIRRSKYQKQENKTQESIDSYNKNLANSFKNVFSGLASDVQNATNELETIKSKATEVSSALGNSFKTWTDRIQDGIRNYAQEITRAKNAIERSEKSIIHFGATVDDILHQTQMKYATDFQQIQLTEQQIGNLTRKAQSLFDSGNINDYQEGVRLIHEIARMEQELFDKRTDYQKRSFENSIKQDLATYGKNSMYAIRPGDDSRRDNDLGSKTFGQNVIPFTVSTDPLMQRLYTLKAFLEAEDNKNSIRRNNEIKHNEAMIESEKARKRSAEELGKAASQFDPRNKDGNVKEEFRDAAHPNRVDQAKVDAHLNKLRDDLLKLKRPQDDDKDEPLKFFIDLENKMTVEHARGLAERRKLDLDDKQLRAQQQQQGLKQEGDAAIRKPGQVALELTQPGGGLDQLVGVLKNLVAVANQDTGFYDSKNPLPGLNERPSRFQARKESDENRRNILEKYGPDTERFIEQIKQKLLTGELTGEQAKIKLEEVRQSLDVIAGNMINMRKLFETQQGKSINDEDAKDQVNRRFIPGTKEGLTVGMNFAEAYTVISEVLKKMNEAEQAKIKGEAMIKSAEKGDFTGFIQSTGSAKIAVETASLAFSEGLYPATKALTEGFQILKQNLNAIQVPNIPPPNIGNPFDWFGINGYAKGGIVAEGDGGVDTVLARLTRGEFVMPVEQTSKFLPQLLAMREGVAPKSYGAGSHVSTTVGDINITIQGPATPEKTIRELGQKLRREIQRGNLIL